MILHVEKLNFSYGNHKVLHDVSFSADKNSIISVLGSNGAGKTTLLKCICNVLNADSGNVFYRDKDTHKMSGRELARHIGYVPQSVAVSRMTVFDAVLLGRKPHMDLTASKNDFEITANVIDAMGLKELSLRYLGQLSGGEFQKVQIARAVAQETEILILDEPSNNLDIANQHRTMDLIWHSVRERDVCAIMTMHDINLAIQYSDLFLFMAKGEICAYGGIEVITEELILKVYGMKSEIITHRGKPLVIPDNYSR